ncbi:ABC transporter ATP-binding protein [Aquisalimonas asiatica]|uniref:Amino acid/amide ABC transporter ATP-binding protein 2, HAAT family n=1 Tax=Aquisalimonas asiatica TaxID=406100 RepID=A0A1H8RIQ1_9GAMM|nr:ABC transporter ATP-binding protein [Aquisalimonas asiatica]SEO66127.1 amino acid/amide ABC transporter ATP-binding protein 2, HAAT family [Aquisalimonas asiatica]
MSAANQWQSPGAGQAGTPALEVSNLEVAYGQVKAVRGVSLTVGQGELVSLIGSNGAGKSSTLKAIAGVIRPVAGAVNVAGQATQGLPSEQMVERGVALVPEGRMIFADQTVEDNLYLGAYTRIKKNDKAGVAEDFEKVYHLFPRLHERRTQVAGSLSGGEQQMLALARGLLSRPTLLMIDEMSLGLAPRVIDTLFPVISQLNDEGLSILLVEQMARLAMQVSSRTYVMENGSIFAEGPSAELARDPRVMEAYLGKSAT